MKNKKTFRAFIMMIAALICLGGFSIPAYAQSNENAETPPTEAVPPEETPPPDPIRLTPDGNLTLVDDIDGEQSEDKQFITVVTKNGNYFYIIIDRAGDKENVYFLNMVDEADLLALIEDDKKPTTPVVTPQPEPEPEPTPEPQPEKKSNNSGLLLLVLLAVGAGGGAFYYFKVLKPKQAVSGSVDASEFDELNFDDEEGDGLIDMDEAVQNDDE